MKRILKIIGIIILVVIISLIIVFNRAFKPLSDNKIKEIFAKENFQPIIKNIPFKGNKFRVICMQKQIDTALPTLLFVHGSPGSAMNFKKYLIDEDLNKNANLIAYDRIGYGENDQGKIVNSLLEEVEVMNQVIQNIDPKKLILIGYSYGGSTVLASPINCKSKILLAAAVKGDLEPMFWPINLYKWKVTRILVPDILQGAAQEKLRHVVEFKSFEHLWNKSRSKVVSVHGNKDRIVPYQNSLFLKELFDKNRFTLVTLHNGSHSLIWTNFNEIKTEILKVIRA